MVVRTNWKSLHLKGPANKALNMITAYSASSEIQDKHVASASNGVAYWNNVVQALEARVVHTVYELRKNLVNVTDPTPVLFVKETMCPSF